MEPGFLLDGRYRLERRLARHGRTQVWCGHDALLERRVTVTVLAVTSAEGALRERIRDATRAAASPAHPCAVTTYDYGEAEGTSGALMYVVTEFLSGEPLAARLPRGLPTAQEAVEVCARVAGALAAAHACGAVHGALTSSQVFLTADGVRLLGLGPAGVLVRAGEGPPEAAGGPDDDVRALGEIIAECLAEGGVPDGVAEVVARCRDGEAGAGRPSAADVARALAAQSEVPDEPAAAPTRVLPADAGRPGRPRGRRAAVVGSACAAVLALALLPLLMILSSLRDAPADVAVPLPSRSASRPPLGSMEDPASRPTAARTPGATASPAVPARTVRAAAVSALARMRRSIDVGMATGEVRPRFGTELATLVTTLLNEVDGGAPVDLPRRIADLRSALAGRAPGDVAPARAAGLGALLAEVPVPS